MKTVAWLLCVILVTIPQHKAEAAGKWDVGFNEEFVSGYLKQIGQFCADCPTNSYAASFQTIAGILRQLAATEHVGAFREIIPVALIEQDKAAGYANIIRILGLYSGFNLHLTLAAGLPLAPSLSLTGSDFAVMPVAAGDWMALKNNIAWSLGGLLRAMWTNGAISRAWMATHLVVEGFNEFDSLTDSDGSTIHATPQRAVALTSGIAFVIGYYGITTQQSMPSVIGAYAGYGGSVDARVRFVADYYAAGGIGYPNVHIYAPTRTQATSYVDVLNAVRQEVAAVTAVLPGNLRGLLFLGETGNADAIPPSCPADNGTWGPSIAPDQRGAEYAAIAADPVINRDVTMLLFWRLMRLKPRQVPGDGCESFYGVLDGGSMTYNAVGQVLFSYLAQP